MLNAESPLVSIVIPCYNHASFVRETIESVLLQDYKNIELIIIDDGSKDNSVEIISALIDQCKSRFVRFEFRSRANKGLCATLNEALAWCEGEYLACVASDDMLKAHKTSTQVSYLQQNPNCVGVFSGIEWLHEDSSRKISEGRAKKYSFLNVFLHKHDLPAATQMLRLDAVRSVGGYPENLIIEDWYMWLRLTETGKSLDKLRDVFAVYRRHGNNISGQFDKMQRGRMQVLDLYCTHPAYSKALAKVLCACAKDWRAVNRGRALSLLGQAFRESPAVIFDLSYIKTLLLCLVMR